MISATLVSPFGQRGFALAFLCNPREPGGTDAQHRGIEHEGDTFDREVFGINGQLHGSLRVGAVNTKPGLLQVNKEAIVKQAARAAAIISSLWGTVSRGQSDWHQ